MLASLLQQSSYSCTSSPRNSSNGFNYDVITGSIQIPIELLQQLSHSCMLGMRNLFPAPLLDEINKTCVQNLQCSAIMNLASGAFHLTRKAKTSGTDNKLGIQVPLPHFMRKPFVVCIGNPLFSPRQRHQRSRACPDRTKQLQVPYNAFSFHCLLFFRI